MPWCWWAVLWLSHPSLRPRVLGVEIGTRRHVTRAVAGVPDSACCPAAVKRALDRGSGDDSEAARVEPATQQRGAGDVDGGDNGDGDDGSGKETGDLPPRARRRVMRERPLDCDTQIQQLKVELDEVMAG